MRHRSYPQTPRTFDQLAMVNDPTPDERTLCQKFELAAFALRDREASDSIVQRARSLFDLARSVRNNQWDYSRRTVKAAMDYLNAHCVRTTIINAENDD